MKVTVCQLPEPADYSKPALDKLAEHVQSENSELVLLPEMALVPWLCARPDFDPVEWDRAVAAHEAAEAELTKLSPATVLGTRPVTMDGRRLNQAFIYDTHSGLTPAHVKYHLPDEEGFWEATWYQPGEPVFEPVRAGSVLCGFAICTEMWFFNRARDYSRQGIHILASPRATPVSTLDKWMAGGTAAAVVSGAFCLSSNNFNTTGGLGGRGWIIDPEGKVLGVTSAAKPFLTLNIDPGLAEQAKKTYPRYVED